MITATACRFAARPAVSGEVLWFQVYVVTSPETASSSHHRRGPPQVDHLGAPRLATNRRRLARNHPLIPGLARECGSSAGRGICVLIAAPSLHQAAFPISGTPSAAHRQRHTVSGTPSAAPPRDSPSAAPLLRTCRGLLRGRLSGGFLHCIARCRPGLGTRKRSLSAH